MAAPFGPCILLSTALCDFEAKLICWTRPPFKPFRQGSVAGDARLSRQPGADIAER